MPTFEFLTCHPTHSHIVQLTILTHIIIVCIVGSAHELIYNHIKVCRDVETTLLKHGIIFLSRLATKSISTPDCERKPFYGLKTSGSKTAMPDSSDYCQLTTQVLEIINFKIDRLRQTHRLYRGNWPCLVRIWSYF